MPGGRVEVFRVCPGAGLWCGGLGSVRRGPVSGAGGPPSWVVWFRGRVCSGQPGVPAGAPYGVSARGRMVSSSSPGLLVLVATAPMRAGAAWYAHYSCTVASIASRRPVPVFADLPPAAIAARFAVMAPIGGGDRDHETANQS